MLHRSAATLLFDFFNPVLNKMSFLLFPSCLLYLLVHFRKLFALFYEGGRLSDLHIGCVFTHFHSV